MQHDGTYLQFTTHKLNDMLFVNMPFRAAAVCKSMCLKLSCQSTLLLKNWGITDNRDYLMGRN